MAADDRFDATLAAALHRYLDPATGPHPRWGGSLAARAPAAVPDLADRRRRLGRTLVLLVAAALAVALFAELLFVSGALRTPPVPSPVPSAAAIVATPTKAPSVQPSPAPTPPIADAPPTTPDAAPCITDWSHRGMADPVGLVDGIRTERFDASNGSLVLVFGHSIDSVGEISIVPARPPFTDERGKRVDVAGSTFFELTLRGLTRKSQDVPDDVVRGATRPFAPTVTGDIAEMRRIQTPRLVAPVKGPGADSTETWVIGLDRPECLLVETAYSSGYGDVGPGDNTVVIGFVPASFGTTSPVGGPCADSWTYTAATAADDLVLRSLGVIDLYELRLGFSGPAAGVRRIAIGPVQGPFREASGAPVEIPGSAFLKLTISGLQGDRTPPVEGVGARPSAAFLVTPFTQIRRIKDSGSSRSWIIGLDRPVCVGPASTDDRVLTIHLHQP